VSNHRTIFFKFPHRFKVSPCDVAQSRKQLRSVYTERGLAALV